MTKLIDLDHADRVDVGKAARRLVEKNFSEERVTGAYLDALESMCRAPLAS
jgi:hypothetical protein